MRATDQEVNPAALQQQVTSLCPLAVTPRKCVCVCVFEQVLTFTEVKLVFHLLGPDISEGCI